MKEEDLAANNGELTQLGTIWCKRASHPKVRQDQEEEISPKKTTLAKEKCRRVQKFGDELKAKHGGKKFGDELKAKHGGSVWHLIQTVG